MGLKTTLFSRFRKKKADAQDKKEQLSDKELSELWKQCPSCKKMVYIDDFVANMHICTHCDHHFRINSTERINYLVDKDSFNELFGNILTDDPLNFTDLKKYKDKITEAKLSSGNNESIITGTAQIDSKEVALGVMEFGFMGGSMGGVVGEKIHRICETAIDKKIPVIIISTSGGARMHEGLSSLMQMAKTSMALQKVKEAGLLYISILVDPTYGGVSASFSMLGDIIIAEPKAKIGFAGPRVIEETIRQKLPKDFQTSEYLLEHGHIDLVCHRKVLKDKVSKLIKMHGF